MKNHFLVLTTAIMATGSFHLSVNAQPVIPAPGQSAVQSVKAMLAANPNQPASLTVICQLAEDQDDPTATAQAHGIQPYFTYSLALNGFGAQVTPGQLRALQNDPRIAGISLDRLITAGVQPLAPPPGKGEGKDKGGDGGTEDLEQMPAGVVRIGAPDAWDGLGLTGAGIGVAVFDTGIDSDHPDLIDNLSGVHYDGAFGTYEDGHGHGTHVSGTIAAVRGNSIGVVGVAPNATIYGVKILNDAGEGDDMTIIGGLDWVMDHNLNNPGSLIHVINMSLGGPGGALDDNGPLHLAIQNAVASGIAVVVSAGNTCEITVNSNVPARFPEVISVGSSTAESGSGRINIPQDTESYFSTDGADITAPGETREDVKGNLIRSVGILSTAVGGGLTEMSGTSMASPHTAGVAALLYEAAGGFITPAEVEDAITFGADNIGILPLEAAVSCDITDGDQEGILSAWNAVFHLP